ncbi:MAG TPA: gliding motility protein GldM [Cytophagales bacterium]|nr:gliding motility protein GldM [Cytophagales bacterium]
MAGGKETPRQKMIGMMYLVLTALLALQVSSAIIDKFTLLNQSLERANVEAEKTNSNVVRSIQATVEKSGNRPKDVAVFTAAQEVKNKTQQFLASLEDVKQKLITKSGGPNEDKTGFANPNAESEVEELMLGGSKNGLGYQLKGLLNQHVDYLNKMGEGKMNFKPLAIDPKDDPDFKDREQKNKDFAEINFQATPLVAALAVISQKQAEITRYEGEVLKHLASKVGAEDVKFDKIVAMVRPESNVVAAGTKYTADMFIAASSTGMIPTMKVNGKEIPVDGEGMGKVEIPATPGNYDENFLSKRTFKAEITVNTPAGPKTYDNEITYFVAKPVISIQSAALSALYMDCGNELNVQVPALGASYNPSFSVNGGSHIPGNKKGFVTVVPTEREVKLSVSSNGNLIETVPFKVKAVPRPEIKAFNGSKEVNLKMGETASSLRSLRLEAVVSDESFKQNLPKDARYRVVEWEVSLAKGSRAKLQRRVNDNSANLSDFAAQAQPGDRLVIEIKKVQRLNFRDKRLDVPISASSSIITIPLN